MNKKTLNNTDSSEEISHNNGASKNVGIIVSGGPAPGINGVISAATNELIRRGYNPIGLLDGFQGLSIANEPTSAAKPLSKKSVWGIYNKGGSILGTSRFNPLLNEEHKKRFLNGLKHLGINSLIVIGGEGSAYLSYLIMQATEGMQIVHVPKTIDNDLILPNNAPSFGFETARYVGTRVLKTVKTDAITTKRWFLVTSMGRKAGFLAIGLGLVGGATLTLIPEQFESKRPTLDDVANIIVDAMVSRMKRGKHYGVALLAEGILDVMDPTGSELLSNCPRDDLGRIRYSSLELGEVLQPKIRELLAEREIEIKVNTKQLGYELRCHPPVSYDVEYTTFLGYGAAKYLSEGLSGITVVRDYDELGYIDLNTIVKSNGEVNTKKVDINSSLYKIALSFMSK